MRRPAVRRPALAAALLAVCAAAATDAGAPATDPTAVDEARPCSPRLTNWRYDEDWSCLAVPGRRSGGWQEPFKYVPFDADAGVYLSTGLEARLRTESYRNNLWGAAAAPDDGYALLRLMPHADLHLGTHVRVFAQLIAADTVGAQDPSSVDRTGADLLQGFAEVRGDDLSLAAGRQMLAFGSERLVSARYGVNVPRAFDTVRLGADLEGWRLDLLWARPVQNRPRDFDDRSDPDKRMWLAYATRRSTLDAGSVTLDLYLIGYVNDRARFARGAGRERRQTLGLRFAGARGGLDWDWEAFRQWGRFGDGGIAAWSLGTSTGYRFADAPLSPRVGLKANIISGDGGSGRLGTFNALFPRGRDFGELSPIGPANLVNLHPELTLDLGGGLTLDMAAVAYWRYSRADGVYDVAGNLLRPPAGAASRWIGAQAEAVLHWQATRTLDVQLSASTFRPGGFLRETGPARPVTLVASEWRFRF